MSGGLHAQSMNKIKCLIDTGAGPNLNNRPSVQQTRTPRVKRRDILKARSASKRPIRSEKVIVLHFQIVNPPIRVWFEVVKALAFDLLLGM